MRALVLLFQVVFWLVVIRIVARAFARVFAPAAPRPGSARAQPGRTAADLVLDRVCRSHVPRAHAIAARVAGREEHFCSAACRDKALAAVARAS